MIDDIKLKLPTLGEDQFENLCVELLPLVESSYAGIEPNMSQSGKTRSGTPDAYVALSDGRYIAFQFTTQQNRVEAKVLEDLRKLDDGECRFKGKVAKVVVCLNTYVGSERETYKQECHARGWEFDIFSLQRMAQCLASQDSLCEKYLRIPRPRRPEPPAAETPKVTYFDCGARLAEIRGELELQPSEFTELIECPSEKQYMRIEQRLDEAPSDLIDRVAARTGASPTWIRHGNGRRYPVEGLLSDLPQSAIEDLERLAPKALFVTLDLEKYLLCGAAQIDGYNWRPLFFRVAINFWTWFDEHRKIEDVLRLFELLTSRFRRVLGGRILPTADQEKLMSGMVHPRTLITRGYDDNNWWVEHIIDLRREGRTVDEYRAVYGDWFVNIQEHFRRSRLIF